MVTRVPCRQEHGRDEKRREWGWKEEEKKRESSGRAPLQASEQVWTVLLLLVLSLTLNQAASGATNFWQGPAGMHRQEFTCWAAAAGDRGSFAILKAVTLDFGDIGGSSAVGPDASRRARASGYATGGKVGSSSLWPGARSRDPPVRRGKAGEKGYCGGSLRWRCIQGHAGAAQLCTVCKLVQYHTVSALNYSSGSC